MGLIHGGGEGVVGGARWPREGKESVRFGAVSESKLLLLINTEKAQFQGQLPNFYIHRNPVSLERKA